MNNVKNITSQISYTIAANFIRMATVGLLTILIPKIISMENYGYWQLYIFYTNYVGFFHLGWCDGIYLKEGGNTYASLDKSNYNGQFILITLMQIIFSLFIIIITLLFNNDINKMLIVLATCVNALLCIPCTFFSYILQCTGRIKEFSFITILGRGIYFIICLIFITLKMDNYEIILIADIIGWGISLLYSIIVCKDIAITKCKSIKLSIKEGINNINIGSKLMFANIASSLIIGFIRLCMEKQWDIVVFGKISLSINFCNLLLIFINAIGIVIYPILKRQASSKLKGIYIFIEKYLSLFLFIALICYFPLKLFIKSWIPAYSDSVMYMAILFPICIFESKFSLLTNTYLKVFRKEKVILLINIFALSISIILSIFTIFLLKNIDLTIFVVLIALIFRCTISEVYICKLLKVPYFESISKEIAITAIFIACSWIFVDYIGILCYFLLCVLLIVRERNGIQIVLKKLMK